MGGYAWPVVLNPTADEVHAFREKTGAGIMEAKRQLRRKIEREAFDKLRAHGDLADKIEWLLDRYEERFLAPD